MFLQIPAAKQASSSSEEDSSDDSEDSSEDEKPKAALTQTKVCQMTDSFCKWCVKVEWRV